MSGWKVIAESGEGALSLSEIEAIICGLSLSLSEGDFSKIDQELKSIDFSKVGPDAIVAMSRTLYPARAALQEWNGFLKRLREEIVVRGLDARILQGVGCEGTHEMQ